MADIVKPEIRSKMMSGIRGKNTQPELALRRGLFARDVRFRLHVGSLPGRPDVVIRRFQTAILVHGCFWHAHAGCRYFKVPQGNRQFWSEKLGRNRQRDEISARALRNAGWRVAIVWECAIKTSAPTTVDLMIDFLRSGQDAIEVFASDTKEGMVVKAINSLGYFKTDTLGCLAERRATSASTRTELARKLDGSPTQPRGRPRSVRHSA